MTLLARRGYGWSPGVPDSRDRLVPGLPAGEPDGGYAPVFSVRGRPPIWDQLRLGTCTAFGASRVGLHELVKQGLLPASWTPSWLFNYWGSRSREGTTQSDAGASVRDAVKVLATLGMPPGVDWPYSDANPGPFQQQPPHKAYVDALLHRALRYYTFALTRWNMKWCLQNGYPVAFGIPVYQSFESSTVASTGRVPNPASGESLLGGHCMVVGGWDDTIEWPDGKGVGCYETDNSWSSGWGDKGRCWIPYKYLEEQANDVWTVRLES